LSGRHVVVDVSRGLEPSSRTSAVLDDEGAEELAFDAPGDGPVHARVHLDDALVGEGSWSLSAEEWRRGARRRGGWVQRRFDGGLVLRAAAERGVFAVPFASALWVEASRDGNAASGLLEVRGDGADVSGPPEMQSGVGPRRYVVTPREHAAVVVLRLRDGDAAAETPSAAGTPPAGTPSTDGPAELDVSLAVVPGALFAELSDADLVVRSPVWHDRAYVAIVSDHERLLGAAVPLYPDGSGASGVLHGVSLRGTEPLWAVVSSEPELRSASLVGWPLRPLQVTEGEAPSTLDVSDVSLLDTVPGAVARELERERRVRLLAGLIAAAALGAAAAAIAARAASARVALTAHLDGAGTDRDATTRVAATGRASVWGVVAAVLSVALAAFLIALFASVAR
jgi:hypothetical protein